MPSSTNKVDEVQIKNERKYSLLLLICVRINKQIKNEFHVKDILFIYNLFFADNIEVQEYYNWSGNATNLKTPGWLRYSKKVYNLIIDLINNLENRINELTPENHLENLFSFFEKIKKKVEEQRKIYEEKRKIHEKLQSKILMRKSLLYISSIIAVTITSIIYDSNLLGFLLVIIIWTWWVLIDKTTKISSELFIPQLDKEESTVQSFLEKSDYLKVLCIIRYKNKIEDKIRNELKNINKLENRSYLEKINPFEFEELIWKALQYFGFKTKVTRKTGDKWVDIWLEKNEEKSIVQCKRFKWKIGTPTIRDFIWTMQMNKIKSWYIITTSNFSVDSLLTVEESDYTIQLIDMDGVISMMQAMNNWEKNKFDEILKESTIRIWKEWNKNYQIKKDNQRRYWLRRKFGNF